MSRALWIVAIPASLVGLAGAFAAGRWTAPGEPAPPAPRCEQALAPPAADGAVRVQPSGDDLRRVIREEVSLIVREELSRHPQQVDPVPAQAPIAPAPPESAESAESAAATAQAIASVDAGIARGRWTREDRDSFYALADGVPVPTRLQIERRLFAAINSGQVALEPGLRLVPGSE